MARFLLVALAWCVVRGEEYGGGAMPQYGAEYRALAEDYRGHSPDAPASLDYNYEEPQGDTRKPPKYVDDSDVWRKSARRRTARKYVKEELELRGEEVDGDAVPEASRRRRRNRPRSRREWSRRDEQTARRRHATARYDPADHYLDNSEYSVDRSKQLKDDDPIPSRETTVRVNRKKLRQIFAQQTTTPIPERTPGGLPELEDEELISNRLMKAGKLDKFDETDFWKGGAESDIPLPPPLPEKPEADADSIKQNKGRTKYPIYQDYTDYYDIKQRINNIIQNKLPVLLRSDRPTTTTTRMPVVRRTTTKRRRMQWAPAAGKSRRPDFDESPAGGSLGFEYGRGPASGPRPDFNRALTSGLRPLDYDLTSADKTRPDIDHAPARGPPQPLDFNLLNLPEGVGSTRRVGYGVVPYGSSRRVDHGIPHVGGSHRMDNGIAPTGGSRRMDYGIAPAGGSRRFDYGIAPAGGSRRLVFDLAPTSIPPHSDFDIIPDTSTAIYTSFTSIATAKNSAAAVSTNTTELSEKSISDVTEQSLAEKSRLSILKKVLTKDKLKSPASPKPAVLLRVTSLLPTVVIVQPATSASPWMRAREVAGDSPATLEKVKRLMRKKLVANAKSIRELTDNWDDPVCDYIDMALLETVDAAPYAPQPRSAALIACISAALLILL